MEFLKNLFQTDLFKASNTLGVRILNFFGYLINLFTQNPLWFLGGMVLLRVAQKGVSFNLKDLFKFDLD